MLSAVNCWTYACDIFIAFRCLSLSLHVFYFAVPFRSYLNWQSDMINRAVIRFIIRLMARVLLGWSVFTVFGEDFVAGLSLFV